MGKKLLPHPGIAHLTDRAVGVRVVNVDRDQCGQGQRDHIGFRQKEDPQPTQNAKAIDQTRPAAWMSAFGTLVSDHLTVQVQLGGKDQIAQRMRHLEKHEGTGHQPLQKFWPVRWG